MYTSFLKQPGGVEIQLVKYDSDAASARRVGTAKCVLVIWSGTASHVPMHNSNSPASNAWKAGRCRSTRSWFTGPQDWSSSTACSRSLTGTRQPGDRRHRTSRLPGVVVTHPHPDHYAGLGPPGRDSRRPDRRDHAVDEIIRRDDQLKDEIVGPMMGDDWPTSGVFPNQTVNDGDDVRLGGLTLSVRALGPGESHAQLWFSMTAPRLPATSLQRNARLPGRRVLAGLALHARPPRRGTPRRHHPACGARLLRRRAAPVRAAPLHRLPCRVGREECRRVDRGDHTGASRTCGACFRPTRCFLMELSIAPVRAALRGAA